MKIKLLIVILLNSIYTFGQSWNWADGYGSGGYNSVHNIKVTPDNKLLITGVVEDTTIFGNDTIFLNGNSTMGFICKMAINGTPNMGKATFCS